MKFYGTVILFVIAIEQAVSSTKGDARIEEEVIALANGLPSPKRSQSKSIMRRINESLKPILRTLENVDTVLRSTRNIDVFKCMERVSCEVMAPRRASEGEDSVNQMSEFSGAFRNEFVDVTPEEEEEEATKEVADDAAAATAAVPNPQHFVQPFLTPGIHYFAQPVGIPQIAQAPLQLNTLGAAGAPAAAAVTAAPAASTAEEINRISHYQQYYNTHPGYYPYYQQQQALQQQYLQQYAHPTTAQYTHPAAAQHAQYQQYYQQPQHQTPQYYTQHTARASQQKQPEATRRSTQENTFKPEHPGWSSYSSYQYPSENRRSSQTRKIRRKKIPKRSIFRRLFRGKRDVVAEKAKIRRRFKRGIMDRILQGINGKSMVEMLDRMMENSNDSLYPYTRAALLGYMGSTDSCAENYPSCPTTMDKAIDTFNNLGEHFPNGIPLKDKLPFPFNVILP